MEDERVAEHIEGLPGAGAANILDTVFAVIRVEPNIDGRHAARENVVPSGAIIHAIGGHVIVDVLAVRRGTDGKSRDDTQ
jgi:hypothetical protein